MKRPSVFFLLGLGCWLLSAPAYGAIALEPDALVISGLENRPLTRTLNLSSDTDIRRLAIAVSDLERTDASAILPASAIEVELPQTALPAGEILQIPITINPSQANGEFTGSLWILYDGIQQTVPITLRTKDPIGLPLTVLLAGVALGSILAWYRTKGLPQDELVVQMGQLRTQMRSDPEFESVGKRFRQRIEADLIDVETALGKRDWAIAKTSLDQAETTWNRWRRGREDWILQIQYLQTLQQEAEKPPLKQTDYGRQVQAQLEEMERRVAEFETPQAMREALLPLRNSMNQFQEGATLLETMALLETRMKDDERREHWAMERDVMETALSQLDPTDPVAYAQWKATFESHQRAMMDDLHHQDQQSVEGQVEAIARRAMAQAQPAKLPLVPGVSSYGSAGAVRSARSRLRIFRLVSQGVAIVFLSWAGLNELYADNPIFGASPVGDYLALAAWGFGAEVTRDSIVKAVQELNGKDRDGERPPLV